MAVHAQSCSAAWAMARALWCLLSVTAEHLLSVTAEHLLLSPAAPELFGFCVPGPEEAEGSR